MKSQRTLIDTTDWDILIVLDACRYDTFQNHYCKYLQGRLERCEASLDPTTGYATTSWLKHTWPDDYPNTTYVSSTPRVNSQIGVDGYTATNHFPTIVDVWHAEWNHTYGTVLARDVDQYARQVQTTKQIVHYLQPHEPYVSTRPPTRKQNPDPDRRTRFSIGSSPQSADAPSGGSATAAPCTPSPH